MIKKNDFIVSCQALQHEPLHSPYIMGRMAIAAKQGGADAIRANGREDIIEIKKVVDLPIIGIIKKDFDDSEVYITPTIKEIDILVSIDVDVIALDATSRIRPGKITLENFVKKIRKKYPNQKIMADCSTFDEMYKAKELGFDFIGTTLFGYTSYSNTAAFENIENYIKNTKNLDAKVIAEGQINTPKQAREIKKRCSIFALVVGGAITRPQQITSEFIKEYNLVEENNE